MVQQTLWRAANLVFAAFFGLATYVQKNDPDPELWMVAYGVPTVVCLTTAMSENSEKRPVQALAGAHLLACVAAAGKLVSDMTSLQLAHLLDSEEGRELGGLLLVIAWLLITTQKPTTGVWSPWLAVVVSVVPVVLWGYYHFYSGLVPLQPEHCQGAI
ncbi:PREDICTED: transmembrane protein 220-like [Branchiostoma belcheri]|uniref:Transmembrane protein 220-like n=1 Tax=Branchiostoma belcheri TaxID=7741 RepID=A0A6P4Z8S4_BRABE|nr:PREDICTED: transmembrane protein 220-like [Branchiostoma belcheri]